MSAGAFEFVEHTADWAMRVYGRDLGQLLLHAAQGMAHLMVATPESLPADETRQIAIDGHDAEDLLVGWLTELAYWAEREQIVFHQFELDELSPTRLRAIVHGGRAAQLEKHIKAVTYHDLEIIEGTDGLEATIVFDV